MKQAQIDDSEFFGGKTNLGSPGKNVLILVSDFETGADVVVFAKQCAYIYAKCYSFMGSNSKLGVNEQLFNSYIVIYNEWNIILRNY